MFYNVGVQLASKLSYDCEIKIIPNYQKENRRQATTIKVP